MSEELYSLRMRSNAAGRHLSGAERLVTRAQINAVSLDLLRRAFEHSRGSADELRLAVDLIPMELLRSVALPDISTWLVDDVPSGRQAAEDVLVEAGVKRHAAHQAIAVLAAGAAPDGSSMRGAMLFDVRNGQRLEADQSRGVRVSRMDLAAELRTPLQQQLAPFGLDNSHVREALVLAAKVIAAPGVVAELCWSDDPDYSAGYVASPVLGYVRFPLLKPPGDIRGGRVFFIDPDQVDQSELVDYLELTPVLATTLGLCAAPRPWSDRA
jgi:6-carboxyhexanoate--CoA ligase